jgi:hypothetical protein
VLLIFMLPAITVVLTTFTDLFIVVQFVHCKVHHNTTVILIIHCEDPMLPHYLYSLSFSRWIGTHFMQAYCSSFR